MFQLKKVNQLISFFSKITIKIIAILFAQYEIKLDSWSRK